MNSQVGHKSLLLGVDVGGTKVAVLVVDSHYQVRSRITMPTLLQGPEQTLSGIVAAVEEAVAQAGAHLEDVAALGLGIPGRVDPSSGLVRSAVNLGWHEMPVGDILSRWLGVPCALENDMRVAAIGMQRHM